MKLVFLFNIIIALCVIAGTGIARTESNNRDSLSLTSIQSSQTQAPQLPVELTVKNFLALERRDEPVTFGAPLAFTDGITDSDSLSLLLNGVPVQCQKTVLARWGGAPSDASRPIQWLLLDFQTTLSANQTVRYQLIRQTPPTPGSSLRIVTNNDTALVIDTGAAVFSLSKTNFRFFDQVTLASAKTFGLGSGIRMGSILSGPVSITVDEQGSERIGITVVGTVGSSLRHTTRMHFYRSHSYVKVQFRLENLNTVTVDEFGQPLCNDYGSPGSVPFDDLSILIAGNGTETCTIPGGELGEDGAVTFPFTDTVSVTQESSGADGWQHLITEAPRLQAGVTQRAGRILVDGSAVNGPNKFGGWLDAYGVSIAIDRCWQNFPKAFRAHDQVLELGLFPGEYGQNHELRAGEYKTHEFLIYYHDDMMCSVTDVVSGFQNPLHAVAQGEYYRQTRAFGLYGERRYGEAVTQNYELYIDYMLEQSPQWTGAQYPWPTLLASVDNFNHYGYVDYGDIPTDFEAYSDVVASPYNVKYDGLRGMFSAFLRTNNETWWELATAAARHYADFDILHSVNRGLHNNRQWFEGGAYGHGYHDERGNLNPHRNYMNPATEMSFAAPGMILHYFFTGDRLVLSSGLELAENIYYRMTHSAYYESGECGDVMRECQPDLDECNGYAEFFWGREGGNALKSWLFAYFVTGEQAYLDGIEHATEYMMCYNTDVSSINSCDRFNLRCTFIRELGEYILYRRLLGLAEDTNAVSVLALHLDFMRATLYNAGTGYFSMCYETPDMYEIHDNWLLAVADSFAVGALVFNDQTMLDTYATPLFLEGSATPFCPGCDFSYNSTKEFVNGVGFGSPFIYAYRTMQAAYTGAQLEMPDTYFSPGETCWLRATLFSGGAQLIQVPFFVILEIYGEYWFWSAWTQYLDFERVSVTEGTLTVPVIDAFEWPETGPDSLSNLIFWAAMTDETISSVIGGNGGIGAWTFGYGPW